MKMSGEGDENFGVGDGKTLALKIKNFGVRGEIFQGRRWKVPGMERGVWG